MNNLLKAALIVLVLVAAFFLIGLLFWLYYCNCGDRRFGSTFGDNKYVGSVTLGGDSVGCPDALLASLPVVVKKASRISGYGSGVYHQNTTDLNTVSLHLELADTTGATVAVSNRVPISAPFSSPVTHNGNAFGACERRASGRE
jgi:hypothetical protein